MKQPNNQNSATYKFILRETKRIDIIDEVSNITIENESLVDLRETPIFIPLPKVLSVSLASFLTDVYLVCLFRYFFFSCDFSIIPLPYDSITLLSLL